MPPDSGYKLVVAAAAVAVATIGFLAFAPLATVATGTAVPAETVDGAAPAPPPEDVQRQSLVESQGSGEVGGIAVSLALTAGIPLLVPSGGRARALRVGSAALLFTGTVLAILSVGIFLLPTAVLMLIAAALTGRQPSTGRPLGDARTQR